MPRPRNTRLFASLKTLSPVCANSHLQAGSPEAVTRHFERRKSSFTLASPNCSIHNIPRIAKLSPSIEILASPKCAYPHLRVKSPAALVASSGYKISGRSVCGDFKVLLWLSSTCYHCTVIRDVSDLGFIFSACQARLCVFETYVNPKFGISCVFVPFKERGFQFNPYIPYGCHGQADAG
jgi:hypothetical protein